MYIQHKIHSKEHIKYEFSREVKTKNFNTSKQFSTYIPLTLYWDSVYYTLNTKSTWKVVSDMK